MSVGPFPDPPPAPLGTPVPSGAVAIYTTQRFWDDGPTVQSIYTADSTGAPLTSVAEAQALAEELQTAAANAEMAPLGFVICPAYELPLLPPD